MAQVANTKKSAPKPKSQADKVKSSAQRPEAEGNQAGAAGGHADSSLVLYLGGAVGAGGAAALAAGGGGGSTQVGAIAPVASANHAPVFNLQSGTVTQQDQPVMAVFTATDPDGDPLTYSVTQGVNGSASIAAGSLTYIPKPGFVGLDSVTATVSDGRGGSVSQTLTIQVRDNVAPKFTSATKAEIAENIGAAQVVYRAAASDASPVTYSLRSWDDAAAFTIDPATGAVTLKDNPDYERKSSYSFTVVATDSAGSSSEQGVTLKVTDVFEDVTAPVFTSSSLANTIAENSGASQVVYTASAFGATAVTYSLKGIADAAAFTINAATGAVTLIGNPDYETKSSYNFTVIASDTSGLSSEKSVTLGIADVQEALPVISVSPSASGFSITLDAAGSVSMSTSGALGNFNAGTTLLTEQGTVREGFLTLSYGGQTSTATSQYVVLGTSSADTIDTSSAGDRIDYIFAGGGDDIITGGSGDDVIFGGLGADVISAGAGIDTYFFDGAQDSSVKTTTAPASGFDTIYATNADIFNIDLDLFGILTGITQINEPMASSGTGLLAQFARAYTDAPFDDSYAHVFMVVKFQTGETFFISDTSGDATITSADVVIRVIGDISSFGWTGDNSILVNTFG